MLQSFAAAFAGPNADDFGQIGDKNLAIADVSGSGNFSDFLNGLPRVVIADDEFELHFRQEVYGILSTSIDFFVPSLTTEAANFGNGHPLNADLVETILHFFQFVVSDDGFDFFHRKVPSGDRIDLRPC